MISVILCAYNPRKVYLDRVLDSLDAQTLDKTNWEFILIDNNSSIPISSTVDLSWHPEAKVIVETEQGLTASRLRGFGEARGDVFVCVDDDNVLAPDYLEKVVSMFDEKPFIGTAGGRIEGEFEIDLPDFARPRVRDLAIREVKHKTWVCGTDIKLLDFAPCGAGLVIRREVAERYAIIHNEDSLRGSLGRSGASLSSGEDSDLVLVGCDMGYAACLDPRLQLTHLIPSERLQLPYLLKLAAGISHSYAILSFIWEGNYPQVPEPHRAGFAERVFEGYRHLRMRLRGESTTNIQDLFHEAEISGKRKALEAIGQLKDLGEN